MQGQEHFAKEALIFADVETLGDVARIRSVNGYART